MRRRIAVLGATDDAIEALPRLASRADLELVCVYDADSTSVRRRLALFEPHAAALLQKLLTDDPAALDGLELVAARDAHALVQGEAGGAEPRDTLAELLVALAEIADADALLGDPAAAFERLLDAAIGATGASGGSLLLADARGETLRVAAAAGIERELWPKIALRLGEGLAGRAWAEGRPLFVRGPADRDEFELAREPRDIAVAALVPLAHAGTSRGVLCLHHATRADAFAGGGAESLGTLGAALGRLATQTRARRSLVEAARRDAIETALRAAVAESCPIETRLASLCRVAADSTGDGVATLWWCDEPGAALRLAASSLPGGALGAAATLAPGAGLDGRAALERAPVLLEREGRLAYAALPLLDGARLLGVLALQMGGGTPDTESSLRALAEALARELAREAALAAARDRAARGDAVQEAALRLLAESDADRLAERLATSAALLLGAEQAVVRVFDPARRSFRVRARTPGADLQGESLVALDRRAADEAVRTRRSIASESGDDPALLVVPILDGARALGTLGLYEKRSPAPARFDARDRETAERLAAFAAIALARLLRDAAPRAGSPLLPADAFARRVEEEIARARAAGDDRAAFLLVTVRVENAEALGADATERAIAGLVAAFTVLLRSFDAVARTAPDTVSALLPEPDAAPAERVARLARAVAERARPAATERPALAFGHAVHPEDGATAADLVRAAALPRLRML